MAVLTNAPSSSRTLRPATFSGPSAGTLYGGDGRDCNDHQSRDLLDSLSTGSGSRVSQPGGMNSNSAAFGKECNWKCTAEGIILNVEMPGLGKEDVKVSVSKSVMSIRGRGKEAFDDPNRSWSCVYNMQFFVSEVSYKIQEMKAVMKNGVLQVSIPRNKSEEVFHVRVE